MAFGPQSPNFGSQESHFSSDDSHEEVEKQHVDAFEALRHSFRPKDDFSEKMQVLVKNMAEPMIRDWLEKHMMSIVENLVRAEIERVARGKTSS